MADWPTIVGTTALGLGATGVVAATRLLVGLKSDFAALKQHVHGIDTQLGEIKAKLPNGEVEETHSMVKEMYTAFKRQ